MQHLTDLANSLHLKKYGGREGASDFLPLTFEQAVTLHNGDHQWYLTDYGDVVRVKINGEPKRWKRQPERIRIPVKYGLRDYFYITERDVDRLLDEWNPSTGEVFPL